MAARDPLEETVDQACRGQLAPLQLFLERKGALPGPRPNLRLAQAAASALLSRGEPGLLALRRLRGLTGADAAPDTSSEFLPMVGVIGTGIEAARARPEHVARTLSALQDFCEDRRPHVRDAVVIALREALAGHPEHAIEALRSWTDGYLQACAVLEAMAETSVLQHVKDPRPCVDRLQECFELLQNAPRSHQRTQGFRALLRELGRAPGVLGRRFPAETAQWLQERAATAADDDLRDALSRAMASMRSAGVREGDLQGAQRALQQSERAPRDPRSYVGPTRGRGRKAKGGRN